MGNLLDNYDTKTDIKLSAGGALKFIEFDEETNKLFVNNTKMSADDTGRWSLDITASYVNELGQEVEYVKKVYFTVFNEENEVISEEKLEPEQ